MCPVSRIEIFKNIAAPLKGNYLEALVQRTAERRSNMLSTPKIKSLDEDQLRK